MPCYSSDIIYDKDILTYPFECNSYKVPEEQSDWKFKYIKMK